MIATEKQLRSRLRVLAQHVLFLANMAEEAYRNNSAIQLGPEARLIGECMKSSRLAHAALDLLKQKAGAR